MVLVISKAYSPSDRLSLFNPFSRNHLSSSCPYQFLAVLRKLRKRLCLQAGIDGGSLSGANTPKTHSWTWRSGSGGQIVFKSFNTESKLLE